MISIGSQFPRFNLPAVSTVGFATTTEQVSNDTYAGQWLLFFWYPADFTTICPTELLALSEQYKAFVDRGCAVLGASTDSVGTHERWLLTEQMSGVQFSLLSDGFDGKRCLSWELDIVRDNTEEVDRATFIIDPEGIIRWICVNDPKVGRNIDEILRVLDALQTDEMCPCNWENGDETINPQP